MIFHCWCVVALWPVGQRRHVQYGARLADLDASIYLMRMARFIRIQVVARRMRSLRHGEMAWQGQPPLWHVGGTTFAMTQSDLLPVAMLAGYLVTS